MCCTTLTRSRKNPCLVMWMPSSFGTWSRTITSPIPALKPVSTGAEMKLATKPSRSSRARSSITPTSAVSVAVAVTSFAGSPSGTTRPSSRAGQDRQRRRRADAEHARRAEQRVDHHRDEGGVEAHGDGQPGDGRVGHGLGQHDRRGRETGDDVETECSQPFLICVSVGRGLIHGPGAAPLLSDALNGELRAQRRL